MLQNVSNFAKNGLAARKAPVTGGAALRGSGLGFVVSGLGFVVLGLGFAVLGLGFAKPWWPLPKNLKKTTRPKSTNSLLRLYKKSKTFGPSLGGAEVGNKSSKPSTVQVRAGPNLEAQPRNREAQPQNHETQP